MSLADPHPAATAVFEPGGLAVAQAHLRRRFPSFDPDGSFAELRATEYGRLDDTDQVYLDYTGGGSIGSELRAFASLRFKIDCYASGFSWW
ncbi:MAG: hypothetical protein QM760_21715 [Nibricoccus sp.]